MIQFKIKTFIFRCLHQSVYRHMDGKAYVVDNGELVNAVDGFKKAI